MHDSESPTVYEVPVRSLLRVFGNPMRCPPWGYCDEFTARDVLAYVNKGKLESLFWNGAPGEKNCVIAYEEYEDNKESTEYHIARIAYMVVNRQDHPIFLEIECPEVGLYKNVIYDGNHRFVAAIVRKDKKIMVTFGGGVDEFHRMFRSAKEVRL